MLAAIGFTLLATCCQVSGNALLAAWLKGRSSKPAVICGVALLAIHFGTWMWVLSWASLALVAPFTASGYLINAFLAARVLGERLTGRRWAGTFLIVVGILLVFHAKGHA